MADKKDTKHIFQQKLWLGVTNLIKEPSSQDPDQPTQYWYSENINVRTDPYAPTLNPATIKESGSVVTDFIKWGDITPEALVSYYYGDTGNIYSRTYAGSWSLLHQAPGSHGNGAQYFYGDDYYYYLTDTTIGRYGPIASNPTFTDDFLTAFGGIPQNVASLSLVAGSSQYATAASSGSLQITGDLTLEAYFYLNSLPSVGNSYVLAGKWDESGATRAYIMDIYAISGFFGNGQDGALVISSPTTENPIDSACTGTAGQYTLSATNPSFAVGQVIFIHQTQGTNNGQAERNVITGYTAGTITLQTPLLGSYVSGAQVRVMPQYTNVTINSTYSPKAWNGTTGGILAFLATGTLSGTGSIVGDNLGFRGASGGSSQQNTGKQGEGNVGPGGTRSTANNGSGGGGGTGSGDAFGGTFLSGGGAGGGNGSAGSNGDPGTSGPGGTGGISVGSADLTNIQLGGGGGESGTRNNTDTTNSQAGNGGAILALFCVTITLTNMSGLTSNGGNATQGDAPESVGAGAGGSILLKCQTATLGTNIIQANGGTGVGRNGYSANGGVGRIVIDYLTSYSGTTTPNINAIQDNTLVTTTSYQARLGISNDGTNFEYLTKNLPALNTGQWNRLSVPWQASASLATFYWNGSSIGTTAGTKTSISSNAALLYIGAKKGASVVGSFTDGLVDDIRIWNAVQSATNIFNRNNHILTGNEGGLVAYYKLDNAATDSTSNANNLTLQNAPAYSTNVPFVDATARLDLDQSYTTTGQTYAVGTAISETTANQLPFTPAFDPQKSMDINVNAKGTGNWTITIHDQTNTVIASQTITNANMKASGYQEFVWSSPWRIVIGKNYHAHITSTVNDGTIVSSSSNVLQVNGAAVGDFHTYFQYLVSDMYFHPAIRWLNFLVFGNERYLAKWDGAFYSPNIIAFPQGTHVRCFGIWGIYLAIGTWQEASTGTPNVYDFPTGKIYFWDGISLTFNFSIDVPEGQINSIFGMDADLYYYAGWRGDLLYYKGTWANQSGSFNGTKVKRIPYLNPGDYMEVYPQAMANYQGLLWMGLAANSNSTKLPRGVYSWGALYPGYPQSLVNEHLISTGNKGNTVKIGMVYPVGQKLLVSWADGIARGVDVIDPTNGQYHTSGLLQTNIIDGEYIYQNDLLLKVRADHLKLNTGEGVQVGYALDREASYEVANSVTDTLNKFSTNTTSNGRATEMSFQAKLTGPGTSTPTLLALAAQIDNLETEQAF